MTQTQQHTPGPWTVGTKHGLMDAYWVDSPSTLKPAIATRIEDARLIAAAPELLEALITALPYLEAAEADPGYKKGAVSNVTATIRAAIAKAEGRA